MGKKLDDHSVMTVWKCNDPQNEECKELIYVDVTFFQENGTPVCCGCDRDMDYDHTILEETEESKEKTLLSINEYSAELSPHLLVARRYKDGYLMIDKDDSVLKHWDGGIENAHPSVHAYVANFYFAQDAESAKAYLDGYGDGWEAFF